MVNVPLTPASSPRTNDENVILQMDRERRQKRENTRRNVRWTTEYQDQIYTPWLADDEDRQDSKRQCIRDDAKRSISYGSGVSFFALSPRNLNDIFQDCESPRNTDLYIREPPAPISPY